MFSRILAGLFLLAAMRVPAAEITRTLTMTMNVSTIVLLALDDVTGITLNVSGPVNAGGPPQGSTSSGKHLLYTAVVPSGTLYKITATWQTGTTPAGTEVLVTAGNMPANCGTAAPAGATIGSSTPVIGSIDSCATGTAAGSGPLLTYALVVTDPAQLAVNPGAPLTVVYTLLAQ